MEHHENAYHLEIVEERRKDVGHYTLFRIRIGDLLRYAVAIEDRAGSELALLIGAEKKIFAFFDQIAEGELSSLQLLEVAEDFRCETILEIF